MTAILFICTGNMYRSPIAAEAFRSLVLADGKQKEWQVSSAGTWTLEGRPAPKDAIEIAGSFGLNLNTHQTRMVNQKILKEADLIIVMEEGHKEALQVEFPFTQNRIYLISEVFLGYAYGIPDPAMAGTRSEIKIILQELVNMIRAGYANIYKFIA